jgi:phosphoribosylglycinamide formyltransferase 2
LSRTWRLSRKLATARISDKELYEAQDMAEKVTEALGGAGLWSRIFLMMVFISQNSPSPT